MTLDTTRLRDLAVSDGGFVFDPVTGQTFTVNDTGLFALRALKDAQRVDDIAASLASVFEVDGSEDIARDLDGFVSRLREQGLVR
jgi:PqqD family protein of HPr-rel-A system